MTLLDAAKAQRPAQAGLEPTVDTALYGGMRYRMVGPFRGGRSTAVTGIAAKPHTFFMGTTGGGVWKTEDAGQPLDQPHRQVPDGRERGRGRRGRFGP